MVIESVIFDFDGVIVDTEPLHYKAFQKILEPLGMGYSWEDYCQTYMGFDDRDAFKEAFSASGKALSQDQLNDLISKKADCFQEIIKNGTTPYPGVVELINHLYASNIPIALCSGALAKDIKPILAELAISHCFSCIITADDVPHSKPDPRCYDLTWQQLQQKHPEKITDRMNCVAIEDTPAGISSAKGAGLKVVAVTNSYPAERLAQADCILSVLTELFRFPFKDASKAARVSH